MRRLAAVASAEDAIAQAGRVSGSIYHGGREHFAFLGEVMGLFAHMNVLQRDMYPSRAGSRQRSSAYRHLLAGDRRSGDSVVAW